MSTPRHATVRVAATVVILGVAVYLLLPRLADLDQSSYLGACRICRTRDAWCKRVHYSGYCTHTFIQ